MTINKCPLPYCRRHRHNRRLAGWNKTLAQFFPNNNWLGDTGKIALRWKWPLPLWPMQQSNTEVWSTCERLEGPEEGTRWLTVSPRPTLEGIELGKIIRNVEYCVLASFQENGGVMICFCMLTASVGITSQICRPSPNLIAPLLVGYLVPAH